MIDKPDAPAKRVRKEPDNQQCREHFKRLTEEKNGSPFKASVGDKETDQYMKAKLKELLNIACKSSNVKQDRVLEIMAGCGRNYSVLKEYFHNIEMLDCTPKMVEKHNKSVDSYCASVQDFDWPWDKYNCIVGCWALCYLDINEREILRGDIDTALNDSGVYIMIEPVMRVDESDDWRFNPWTEQ